MAACLPCPKGFSTGGKGGRWWCTRLTAGSGTGSGTVTAAVVPAAGGNKTA
jgi:hypothetical protein